MENISLNCKSLQNPLNVKASLPNILTKINDKNAEQHIRLGSAKQLFSHVKSSFQKWPPTSQDNVKQKLLLAVQNTDDSTLLVKLCEIIGFIANLPVISRETALDAWPQLQALLSQSLKIFDNKPSVGHIFVFIPKVIDGLDIDDLKTIIQCLMLSRSSGLRLHANRIMLERILKDKHDQNKVWTKLQDLLTPMLIGFNECIQDADDDQCLKLLLSVAAQVPAFFSPRHDRVGAICFKLATNKDLNTSWRLIVIAVMGHMYNFCSIEARKKLQTIVENTVLMLWQQVLQVTEDDNWGATFHEFNFVDGMGVDRFALEALQRLAMTIKNGFLHRLVDEIFLVSVHAESWVFRHGALMVAAAIARYRANAGDDDDDDAVDLPIDDIARHVIERLRDPSLRVRYAACVALNEHSGRCFIEDALEEIVEALVSLLDDVTIPRLRVQVVASLRQYCHHLQREIPAWNDVMKRLVDIIETEAKNLDHPMAILMLEQALPVARTIMLSDLEYFQHADCLLTAFNDIINSGTSKQVQHLRREAIDCSIVVFRYHIQDANVASTGAKAFMESLLNLYLQDDLQSNDQDLSSLLSSWAELFSIIGQEFQRYVPYILVPAKYYASLDVIQSVKSITPRIKQKLKVKASAVRVLKNCAIAMGDHFINYVEEVLQIVIPLLTSRPGRDVRKYAAQTLPHLLKCLNTNKPECVSQMWATIFPNFMKALRSENDENLKLVLTFVTCIKTLDSDNITDDQLEELCQFLNNTVSSQIAKSDQAQEGKYLYPFTAFRHLEDIFAALFFTLKLRFLPYFDRLVPQIGKMLEPTRQRYEHQFGFKVFTSLIGKISPYRMVV